MGLRLCPKGSINLLNGLDNGPVLGGSGGGVAGLEGVDVPDDVEQAERGHGEFGLGVGEGLGAVLEEAPVVVGGLCEVPLHEPLQ